MTTAHMGNPTTYSYPPDGLSGIVRYDSRTSTYTPYAVETDHLGSITALYNSSGTKVIGASFDAWGKRTQTTSTLEFRRGYTAHEHIDGYDLINMNSAIEREHGEFYSPVPSVSRMGEANGRVYDPLIGRFLSPDPFVQMPDFSQSFNRYSYCLNNPLKYTDPDGESIIAVAVMALFACGMANVFIQADNGNINTFGDALNALIGGSAAGFSEASSWAFGFAELASGTPFGILIGHHVTFSKSVNLTTTMTSCAASILRGDTNAPKIILGRYYTDENGNVWEQALQGLSRFTWEGPQTWAGYNWSHIRNIIGDVDKVDYLGGATFSINENGSVGSVSLGNYINADIDGSYNGRITDYPVLMHEYGHTFDSREAGPAYLFTIGIPSLNSAINSNEENGRNHRWFWTELRANRAAKKYFGRYYGVDWSQYENDIRSQNYYPIVKPKSEVIKAYIEYLRELKKKNI